MGAAPFITQASGKDARSAFQQAVETAEYDNGHSGYTGTIAEKSSFVEIPLEAGKHPYKEANRFIDEDDEWISDKWGPAGCISLGKGEYLFFGWASN